MKYFRFALFIIAMILSIGCEEIEDIYGDSNLKIINKCQSELKIYFDNSYIGKVDSEDNRTWSVPSGSHEIKATCFNASSYVGIHYFSPGETTVIPLEIQSQFSMLQLNQSKTGIDDLHSD